MSRVVIFGAGSLARLTKFYFETDSELEPVAFTVDREHLEGEEYCGLPLVPFDEILARHPPAEFDMFVALGYKEMNRVRARKYEAARQLGYRTPTYVSSRCTYLSQHPPGENCLILEDNTIQAFARIGNDVTLAGGNVIGHDAVIGDHVYVSSEVVVGGFTRVEPYCFLGVNATLRDDITLGEATIAGAGVVLMSDTKPGSVYLAPQPTLLDVPSDLINI